MNEARAEQIVDAYLRARGGSGWVDLVDGAVRSLLPDTDEWAVFRPSGDEDPVVLAVDGGALYRLRDFERSSGGSAIVTDRFDLRDGRAQVIVTETRGRAQGAVWRQRTWRFTLKGHDDPLEFDTEQLLAQGSEPDQLERVGRAAAGEIGWPVGA